MSQITPGDPLGGPAGGDAPITPAAPEKPFETIGYTSPPPPGAGGPAPTAIAPAPGQFVLAGWGSRAIAAIIDTLIIGAVALMIMVPLGIGAFSTDSESGIAAVILAAVVFFLIFALVALLYAPVMMWKTNGKTIGRMAVGIRVVRASGEAMTFGTAMLREVVIKALAIGIASSVIPLLPYLIDVLWPLWDDENRALHDFPVNTRVVKG